MRVTTKTKITPKKKKMTQLKRPMTVADMKALIKDLPDEAYISFHSYDKGCGLNSYDMNDVWVFPKEPGAEPKALVMNPGDYYDPRRPGQVSTKKRDVIRKVQEVITFEDVPVLDPFMAGWNVHRAGGERAEGEEYEGCRRGWDEREKLHPRKPHGEEDPKEG